jgi:hypothetical protein
MSFGLCSICGKATEYGPVVVAEIIDSEPVSFAHGQCWIDSGGTILRTDELSRAMIERASEIGYHGLVDGNEHTAPPPHENHVRDAVWANL